MRLLPVGGESRKSRISQRHRYLEATARKAKRLWGEAKGQDRDRDGRVFWLEHGRDKVERARAI